MTESTDRAVVRLLTAQALAFGGTLALLVVPANALFLDAYGSKWLPATYIAIAVVGSGASALIARAARRTRLARVATASLVALAVLYAASWAILVAGGAWVSALLLVLFPIALQLGFVFIGGQAGRLLDVRVLKERFPRIVTGFSVGFLLGGLLGIPLLDFLGSTEHLLLATTVVQLVFLGLLLATERRFPEVLAAPAESSPAVARPSARVVFASRLVLLLLAYQVLSAMGSQLLDFLLYNRAQARYSGDDLTRFLSAFTALLNLADILFLALIAGPVMRRFGLRIGLVLNPAVVAALLAAMTLVVAGPGAATLGLFALVGLARVADIVLTDGTTRTSVNASFQVVPVGDRLAVQAVVEGIGVPVAIGATGAVLLALNFVGLGTGGVIVFGVVLSVIWTWSGAAMYRSYTRALAEEMRRRPVIAGGLEVVEDDAALHSLLASDDARDVRLGLDLLPGGVSTTAEDALRRAAEHADPELRMRALVQLATGGDASAARDAAALAGDLARSDDPAGRRAAASALAARAVVPLDERLLGELLDDSDVTVRAVALDGVLPEDADRPEVVRRAVAAVEDVHTAGSAIAAVRRLGDTAVPLLSAALARDGATKCQSLVRAAAGAVTEHGLGVIAPALHDPDRVVILKALEALDSTGFRDAVPPDVLDNVFDDAAEHAARSAAARESVGAGDDALRRALDDEIDLARRLVIAALTLRYGDRVRDAVRVAERADGQRRALGVEALDVLLTRKEAAAALPLVRRDLRELTAHPSSRSANDWIADMTNDPERVWRSSWLALCARHAANA